MSIHTLMCLLPMIFFFASAETRNENFSRVGDKEGLKNESFGIQASRIDCSRMCMEQNCLGFAVRKSDSLCILATQAESLPKGTWTIYESPVMSFKEIPLLLRTSGAVNFDQTWLAYKAGFGDNENFWAGLDFLHDQTTRRNYGLMVRMTDWNDKGLWAYYSSFSVGPGSDNYRLSVSGYDVTSTAGDSMINVNPSRSHDGMQFTTSDRDNDNKDGNCAALRTGGWWYHSCYSSHPTGTYFTNGATDLKGINWEEASGYPSDYSFKTMKFDLIPN